MNYMIPVGHRVEDIQDRYGRQGVIIEVRDEKTNPKALVQFDSGFIDLLPIHNFYDLGPDGGKAEFYFQRVIFEGNSYRVAYSDGTTCALIDDSGNIKSALLNQVQTMEQFFKGYSKKVRAVLNGADLDPDWWLDMPVVYQSHVFTIKRCMATDNGRMFMIEDEHGKLVVTPGKDLMTEDEFHDFGGKL
jgi:hypothetical protein